MVTDKFEQPIPWYKAAGLFLENSNRYVYGRPTAGGRLTNFNWRNWAGKAELAAIEKAEGAGDTSPESEASRATADAAIISGTENFDSLAGVPNISMAATEGIPGQAVNHIINASLAQQRGRESFTPPSGLLARSQETEDGRLVDLDQSWSGAMKQIALDKSVVDSHRKYVTEDARYLNRGAAAPNFPIREDDQYVNPWWGLTAPVYCKDAVKDGARNVPTGDYDQYRKGSQLRWRAGYDC
jgi:hypothetical protein